MSNYTMEQTACFTGGRPKSLYEDICNYILRF